MRTYGGGFPCLVCQETDGHSVSSQPGLEVHGLELAKLVKTHVKGSADKTIALARIGNEYLATISGNLHASMPYLKPRRYLGANQVGWFLDLQDQVYRHPSLPNISLISTERFGRGAPRTMAGRDPYDQALRDRGDIVVTEFPTPPTFTCLEDYLDYADTTHLNVCGHQCALTKLVQYIAEGCNARFALTPPGSHRDLTPYAREHWQNLQAVEYYIPKFAHQVPWVAPACDSCKRILSTLLCPR